MPVREIDQDPRGRIADANLEGAAHGEALDLDIQGGRLRDERLIGGRDRAIARADPRSDRRRLDQARMPLTRHLGRLQAQQLQDQILELGR
ncbi:hypothetical protein D3C87_1743190 [compost metagenome]